MSWNEVEEVINENNEEEQDLLPADLLPADDAYLLEAVKELVEAAKQNLQNNEDLMPAIIFIGPNRQRIVIPVPFDGHEEKRAAYNAVGRVAKLMYSKVGMAGVITINDARMAKVAPEEDLDKIVPGSIANNPNNQEALIVVLTRPGHEPCSTIVAYERDADGKVTKFLDPVILDGDKEKGAEFNLLPRWWE